MNRKIIKINFYLYACVILVFYIASCSRTTNDQDRTGDWFIPNDIIQINLEKNLLDDKHVYCMFFENNDILKINRIIRSLPRTGGEEAKPPSHYAMRVIIWGRTRETLDLYLESHSITFSNTNQIYTRIDTVEAATVLDALNKYYQQHITENDQDELPVIIEEPTNPTF